VASIPGYVGWGKSQSGGGDNIHLNSLLGVINPSASWRKESREEKNKSTVLIELAESPY